MVFRFLFTLYGVFPALSHFPRSNTTIFHRSISSRRRRGNRLAESLGLEI